MCKFGLQHHIQVTVHAPDETPFVSRHFVRLSPDGETMLTVRPLATRVDSKLRGLDVQQRQCLFTDERHLKYFRQYTQRNCEIECVTDNLVRQCGCTRFSMPRKHLTHGRRAM